MASKISAFYIFQHPISRWIARYLLDPPEKDYEKQMALLDIEAKKTELRYVTQLKYFKILIYVVVGFYFA